MAAIRSGSPRCGDYEVLDRQHLVESLGELPLEAYSWGVGEYDSEGG